VTDGRAALPPDEAAPSGAWLSRQAAPGLVLYFRPRSLAAEDAEHLAERYARALAEVARGLELRLDHLPTIRVYLGDAISGTDETTHSPTFRERDADFYDVSSAISVAAAYVPETGCPAPEAELARALLSDLYPGGGAAQRFWLEGLTGRFAARAPCAHAEPDPSGRCAQLLDDGLLPPIDELIEELAQRGSPRALHAAASFADYVVTRFGVKRYLQLLRAANSAEAHSFGQVYHLPLAVVDRDWRRLLETVGRRAEPSRLETLKRLLPLARPYWRQGLLALALMLASIAFSLVLPLAFRFLVDNILSRRPLEQAIPLIGERGQVIPGGSGQVDSLVLLALALATVYVLSAIARLLLSRLLNVAGESFVLELRLRLLETLSRLPTAYFARASIADINQRVVQDTAAIQTALVISVAPMVAGALSVVLYAVMLFGLNVPLALISLSGLPILALVYRIRRRNLRAASRERLRRLSDLSGRINEFAGIQSLIKIYQATAYVLGVLAGRLEIHRQLNAAYANDNSRLAQVGTLVMNLTQVAVLLVGGYIVVTSNGRELAPGGLVAFYVLMSQLFPQVASFASASQGLVGAAASVDRVIALLEEQPEPDPPGSLWLKPLRSSIRFEEVGFAYETGRPVLRGLSLDIPAGATVAFVGPTGAGKSSVVQLLPRLYGPTAGRILWDGVDIAQATLASLRDQILLVPQESLLLGATVHDNIRFGLAGVSDEDVRRAASQAVADEFIRALPDGYETIIGDRGIGLSGGQRQRIALARALLRRPSVLILDEATSALDATTQRQVQEMLRMDRPDRTIVKIAHRLETIADADVIIVLEHGRLAEQGRHTELLERDGVYARLYRDQVAPLATDAGPSLDQALRWLGRMAPFCELPGPLLSNLGQRLRLAEYRAGQTISHQGQELDHLCLIGRGRVQVLRQDESGEEHLLTTLGVGTPFGLSTFLTGGPRTTTVRAATDVLLFALARSDYARLVARAGNPA
jgi:subfamily B ATP-binding cassette protein MsbA